MAQRPPPAHPEEQGPWLDPSQWPAALEGSVGAVLRAVGNLLVAISGDGPPQEAGGSAATGQATPATAAGTSATVMEQATSEPQSPPRGRPAPPPNTAAAQQQPQPPQPPSPGEQDDVSLILADARSRAHDIIEQSVAQAKALLQQQRGGGEAAGSALEATVERIRRMVAELAAEVRALHGRLDSIEGLLRSREPASAAAAAAGREGVTTPSAEPTPPPSPAAPLPAAAPAAIAEPATADVGPDDTAGAVTADVGPNASGDATPAVAEELFSPEGGSVLLRVSPVSGFQGLMRVQDTLVRLRAVRDASMEAYSHSEARLRVQLAEPVDSASLAAALGEGLAQEARVQSASLPERSLHVALG